MPELQLLQPEKETRPTPDLWCPKGAVFSLGHKGDETLCINFSPF